MALDQGTGWLGVRVPDDKIALALAAELRGEDHGDERKPLRAAVFEERRGCLRVPG